MLMPGEGCDRPLPVPRVDNATLATLAVLVVTFAAYMAANPASSCDAPGLLRYRRLRAGLALSVLSSSGRYRGEVGIRSEVAAPSVLGARDSQPASFDGAAAGAPRAALERACGHLLSLQDPDGWWKGELETNVTMDAEDLLLREFLGIREPEATERAAAWIRSQQRGDGSWSNFFGGPGDLSTTVEAYVALRLAGDHPDTEHMRAAAEVVRAGGGVEGARVFTHIWLALFGAWPWRQVPALPAELMLLPPWVPLNVYDFGCWARQTVVALSVVLAYRPSRPLPFAIDELHGSRPWSPPTPASLRGQALVGLDRLLRLYQRRPLRALRA